MKKMILISVISLSILAIGCKKDAATLKDLYLLSIKYTTPAGANETYSFQYNSNNILTRVDLTKPISTDNHYFIFHYTGTQLDSIVEFNYDDSRASAANTVWSSGKMTGFWILTYEYDGQNRITKKQYFSGTYFRVVYAGDSVSYFYYNLVAEHLNFVSHISSSIRNPFRIKSNESIFPMNDFVLNDINSDFSGMLYNAESSNADYNDLGVITYETYNTFEGSNNGYPLKIKNYEKSGTLLATYEFTYRE